MKKLLIDLFDLVYCNLFLPLLLIVGWIVNLFLGCLCLIGPFLEGEHYWEILFMWPIGIILLFITIGLPFVLASGSFKDIIEKNKEVI